MAQCSQCSNPAMFLLEGHPVCLHCYATFQQLIQARIATLNQELNYIADMAESMTGIYGVMPRYKVPQPVVHTGPMTFHNINVNKSVVGSINTGTIQRLNVALSQISLSGNEELQAGLKQFAEAVLDEATLDAKFRNDLLEQLAFISTQLASGQESRQRSVLAAVVESVANAVTTAGGLAKLWEALRPMIEKCLGAA
jgi:hypothetical protein